MFIYVYIFCLRITDAMVTTFANRLKYATPSLVPRNSNTNSVMAKWFARKKCSLSNSSRGVKVVYLNIDNKKSSIKLENSVKNIDANGNECFPTSSRESVFRNNSTYCEQVDVVDVRTLKHDIKKLLQDTNAKITRQKLTTILQSVDLITKRCDDLTLRLQEYEERIKCLENRSLMLSDKNKQLELKICDIEQLVNDSEICNEYEKNYESPNKLTLGGKSSDDVPTIKIITCDENGQEGVETNNNKDFLKEKSIYDGETKVKILLWQMKQKIKATYKYKYSKDARCLLNNQENIKLN